MAELPRTIFFIDDSASERFSDLAEEIFPDATVHAFEEYDEALAALEQGSLHPDLLVLDATQHGMYAQWGAQNGVRVIKWLQEHAPDSPLPVVVFHSADHSLAQEARGFFHMDMRIDGSDPRLNTAAADKSELGMVRDIMMYARGEKSRLRDFVYSNDLRILFNKIYDLKLPVTSEEIEDFTLAHGTNDPEEMMRLVQSGKMQLGEVLRKIEDTIRWRMEYKYKPSVDDKSTSGDFQALHALVTRFARGTGDPVTGPVAFSPEELAHFPKEHGKPILITPDVTPDIVQLFGQVAGLVVLKPGASGHIEMLAQAHRIPALLGRENSYRQATRTVLHAPKNEPENRELRVSTTVDLGDEDLSADRLFHYGAEELSKLKEPRRETDQKAAATHRMKFRITPGSRITLDPGMKRMFPIELPITEQYRNDELLSSVQHELHAWHREHDIRQPEFKSTVDIMDQTFGDAIGLLRTEHLILSHQEALQAFRAYTLENDAEALQTLAEIQTRNLEDIFSPMSHHDRYNVRVRLLDAPPTEFFDAQGLQKFAERFGDAGLRGVQLAEKIPDLYAMQIRAAMKAYQYIENLADDDFYMRPGQPLEIMVPTVRNAAELQFVKDMAATVATELGFAPEHYRFGSMLETKDACANISSIVPLCDFISIGTNDLTSEILECDRNDWNKRNKLTLASSSQSDPFVTLHEKVATALKKTVAQARKVNAALQVDLCGAHGADLPSLNMLRPLKLAGISLPPSQMNHEGLPLLYMMDTFLAHDPAAKTPTAKKRVAQAAKPAND